MSIAIRISGEVAVFRPTVLDSARTSEAFTRDRLACEAFFLCAAIESVLSPNPSVIAIRHSHFAECLPEHTRLVCEDGAAPMMTKSGARSVQSRPPHGE
jgi:hypothetical protein